MQARFRAAKSAVYRRAKNVKGGGGDGGITADFTGTPLFGSSPLEVEFTDTSTGSPTSWFWEKNDGSGWVPFEGTPTAQNPTEDFT